MDFYKYLNEFDIHVVNYSRSIDVAEGLARIDQLGKYFAEHIKNRNTLKVLLDTQGYINENPETHNALAKIARTKFNREFKNISIFTAVLNDRYTCSVSEKEHWFTIREDAINWLIKQSA